MSIPTVPLGSHGLRISRQGLGCMGMSAFYGSDDEKESIATLQRAIELGVTFWDTAQMYGWGANEELLGRVFAGRRDQVVVASKFGVIPDPDHPDDRSRRKNDGSPANVRRLVDAALRRLGTDHIDLYYQHRPDPDTPVEETAGALAEQIRAGKIRYYGLSEVSPELVRRAHATYPLTAVQSEYSLRTRENVEQLLPVQRELGIGTVAYAPLGRGFLTGRFTSPADFEQGDFRASNPRFAQDAFEANVRIVDVVKQIAAGKGVTPAQVALAWVDSRGDDVVPSPAPAARPGWRRTSARSRSPSPGTSWTAWSRSAARSLALATERPLPSARCRAPATEPARPAARGRGSRASARSARPVRAGTARWPRSRSGRSSWP
jgi:aryl-alcohol dehydrogenase-like predicted oxidoreductase